MDFKPFDSKVLSFSVRDIFDRFLMNLPLFLYPASRVSFDLPRYVGKRKVDSASQLDFP